MSGARWLRDESEAKLAAGRNIVADHKRRADRDRADLHRPRQGPPAVQAGEHATRRIALDADGHLRRGIEHGLERDVERAARVGPEVEGLRDPVVEAPRVSSGGEIES